MRRANWVLRATSLGFAALSLAFAACAPIEPAVAPEGTLRLTKAEYARSAPGELTVRPPKSLTDLSGLSWTAMELPSTARRNIAPSEAASDVRDMESVTAWYRIEVPGEKINGEMNALYLPRWHTWGNLAIYADGALIYSSLDDGVFSSFNDPLLVRLPVKLATNVPLQLVVRMDSVRVIGGALSSIWLGPMQEMRSMFETRRMLQNRLPQITSSIFLVLGVFALGFWIRRRHEKTQLLFFILSVLFYARNLHYYIEDTELAPEWFSWMTIHSLGWLNVVVYLFAESLHRQSYRWPRRMLVGAMTLASVISLPNLLNTNLPVIASFTYLVFIFVSFAVASIISYASWRGRSIESGVLAGILWLNIALGVHDWTLQNWITDLESIYMLPLGVVALFVMFLTTELRRYLGAVAASERAGELLAVKLAARERELGESYKKLQAVEQAQLLSQERQRLMREMHDGLGSALMSSLVAVQRGQMRPDDIAQVLRECVDDLKMTIDSLEPMGDDLLVLLATLRYRLEPRLQAAGIQLIWDIQPVPTLPWLNASSSLQILRMLQEVLTNVLKHAQARSIRVATTHEAASDQKASGSIVIAVTDDGVGFDVGAARRAGRGLNNLQRRAAEIGSQLSIESTATGTVVKISLALTRTPETV